MVTKDGDLYIFGKDSSQSDYTTGQVTELKGQIVTQVNNFFSYVTFIFTKIKQKT